MHSLWHDICLCIKSMPMALYFAWSDTKARYRRSVLGPFWIVFGTLLGATGLGVLWSELLNLPRATLVPSLTVGLVVWQLLTGTIVESTNVFMRYAPIVRNIKTSFLIFPIQLVIRQLINFLHNFLVVVVVLFLYPPVISSVQLWALPGLVLVVGNLLWMAVLLGMLGARFRDFEPLVTAIMPMLFFISPVLYRSETSSLSAAIMWGNPLTYLITVLRDPLLGIQPSLHVYAVTLLMMLGGWAVTLSLFSYRHHRIAFWV